MFTVNDDLSIYLTRGDTLFFNVRANDHGYPYTFKPGDIVRISVTAKKDVTDVYIQKDFPVQEASKTVFIYLEGWETKIGEKINKYKDYWYEIVLNPDTVPQTIIGHNDDGAKILRLFPEADDVDEKEILPEEIPVIDTKLDMTSQRPVSNAAVAIAIAKLTAAVEELKGNMPASESSEGSVFNAVGQVEGLSVLVIDAYGVAVRNGFEGTAEEWLESLRGKKGDPFSYDDFTPEQLELLRGPQGDPFTYEDFTPEQLEALKVRGNDGITPHIGENGNWFIGETDTGVPAGGTSVLIVDITKDADEKYYSSHSASEIKVQLENGSFVVGRYGSKTLVIEEITEKYVSFAYHKPGGSGSEVYRVFDDKTVLFLNVSHHHSEMISTNTTQSFSNAQKSQARENIGAMSKDDVTETVMEMLIELGIAPVLLDNDGKVLVDSDGVILLNK